jgi:hypothetical protein
MLYVETEFIAEEDEDAESVTHIAASIATLERQIV